MAHTATKMERKNPKVCRPRPEAVISSSYFYPLLPRLNMCAGAPGRVPAFRQAEAVLPPYLALQHRPTIEPS